MNDTRLSGLWRDSCFESYKAERCCLLAEHVSQDVVVAACLKRPICWASPTTGCYCHQTVFIEHAVTVL